MRDARLPWWMALLLASLLTGCGSKSTAPPISGGPIPALVLTPVVSGLTSPVDLQFPNDGSGRMFIVQQAGSIRIVNNGSLVATPFLDITAKVSSGGEMGLLGLAFHPQFMRNEVPAEGRWLNSLDELERRRVIFLGGRLREQLFSGRPAVGETVLIKGVPFQVVGVMARKIQLSNYFSSDDESSWIPYSAAGDLWNTRYGSVIVFEPIAPQFEKRAMAQVLAAIASRQQFSPTDPKAIQMFGREEFRPVIDGLTIGLQVLLTFIGTLTLGIGGVGVMNIMCGPLRTLGLEVKRV